ncbi:MAG: hypothetical protein H6633_24695 [Anaerolineales bacterium]|nr:hypothetical protein [Anaerolineales bacterium]
MGTTCVFDYYERLALGSHLFPGSSLHSNLTNQNLGTQGIRAKDVSIPVKEILPQELNKTMTATQDQIHEWAISKETNPASLIFNNTCDPDSPTSQTVQISVTWTKLAATQSGDITVKTEVKAKNPAARTITVNVTDEIRSGTTVLDTLNSGDIDVPANTEMVVLSHMLTVPEGTTELNDVATATYTDKVTGVPVPGNTTAEAQATVEPSGVVQNATATINDVESITGANLSFSVDSFTGASGAFDNSYVAGTETTGPVSWTSDEQSDSGSVSFTKSVYIAEEPARLEPLLTQLQ